MDDPAERRLALRANGLLTAALLSCVLLAAAPARAQSMASGLDGWHAEPLLTIGATLPSSHAFNDLGDLAGGYAPVGVLDGLGAYRLDTERIRVFANHELHHDQGYAYRLRDGKGGTFALQGARISYFDIDRRSRKIIDAGLAYDKVYDADGTLADGPGFLAGRRAGFSRFCSGMLVEPQQFGPGRGLEDRIYFAGEESGGRHNPIGGAFWALDPASGSLWHLPALGRGAWENLTELDSGDDARVAFLLADDVAPFDFDGDGREEAAPLYLYIGKKQPGGDFAARNGLRDGALFVFVPEGGVTSPASFKGAGSLPGSWVQIDSGRRPEKASADGSSGYGPFGYPTQRNLWLQARELGAFGFSAPEDLATNPRDGRQAAFASTGAAAYAVDPESGNGADSFGTVYIVTTDFSGPGSPKATLTILYDGDADPARVLRSPDNLDWADDGAVLVQEDKAVDRTLSGDEALFGADAANPKEAGILRIDPRSGTVRRIAAIERTAVLDASLAAPGTARDHFAGEAGRWETSGILEVSGLFGEVPGSLFLFDVQAHGIRKQRAVNAASRLHDGDLVEGGQLLFLMAPAEGR